MRKFGMISSRLLTSTDANAMLRILFSRLGQPHAGPSFHYGFNSAVKVKVNGVNLTYEGLIPGSLSGGEAQRVKIVRHLGSSLTDVTYVFDEATVGRQPG